MKRPIFFVTLAGAVLLCLSAIAAAQGPCRDQGSIRSVTKARAGNLETVTFVLNSPAPPEYVIEDAHPPFTYSESDDVVHVRGKVFKSIQFRGVFWTCKIAENFKARTATITDVEQDEQFEGYVSYVIGYTKRSKYVGKSVVRSGKRSKVILKFRR